MSDKAPDETEKTQPCSSDSLLTSPTSSSSSARTRGAPSSRTLSRPLEKSKKQEKKDVPDQPCCRTSPGMASVNPEDLKLPMAPIVKLIKNAAGDGVNFNTEAKTSIARAAAVFCLHAVECANDEATKKKHKTITAEDVVAAMDTLDVPEFKEQVKATIEEYRAVKSSKAAGKGKK